MHLKQHFKQRKVASKRNKINSLILAIFVQQAHRCLVRTTRTTESVVQTFQTATGCNSRRHWINDPGLETESDALFEVDKTLNQTVR